MKEKFRYYSCRIAELTGTPMAFGLALLSVILWLFTGPIFHFSDTWQLIINTGTTVITFLMVFLIQHAQNRDTKAIQLKLSELLRSSNEARNEFVDLEEMSDEELDALHQEFRAQYSKIKEHAEKRGL